MIKMTFGIPEQITPVRFCKNLKEEYSDFALPEICFKETARGCLLEMPLAEDEQVYGLGLQLKGFNHRKTKKTLRVNADPVNNAGDTHAPVPFFVTTHGIGVYIDTARYAEFYFGYIKKGKGERIDTTEIPTETGDLYRPREEGIETNLMIEIPVAKGVDVYFFKGENITDVVSQYNRFSGGGCKVPEWGLGVYYRCNMYYNDREILRIADYFRKNDIPCDVLGLEPGWQNKTYSCSYVWSPKRFPEPDKMIEELKKKGYHLNLWEHAFVHPMSPIYESLLPYSGEYEVWGGLVTDFSTAEARSIFAEYHNKTFVTEGIDGFKLDECDGSDYTGGWSFPNCTEFADGMDGEQYHSLFGTLYMQAIQEALDGKETYSQVRNAGALASSYPFVLYSDLYDHKDFIRGVVNAGFSGLLWSPELREGSSKEDLIRRIQTVVFSAQCMLNEFYCEGSGIPWVELGCEDEVRELLKVRESLKPMLKRAFEEYQVSGKPPIRALVSDYTQDKETWNIDDQYLFCDNLLVAPIMANQDDTRKVYIPEGEWRDYWTKESVQSGWREVNTKRIPVYERLVFVKTEE